MAVLLENMKNAPMSPLELLAGLENLEAAPFHQNAPRYKNELAAAMESYALCASNEVSTQEGAEKILPIFTRILCAIDPGSVKAVGLVEQMVEDFELVCNRGVRSPLGVALRGAVAWHKAEKGEAVENFLIAQRQGLQMPCVDKKVEEIVKQAWELVEKPASTKPEFVQLAEIAKGLGAGSPAGSGREAEALFLSGASLLMIGAPEKAKECFEEAFAHDAFSARCVARARGLAQDTAAKKPALLGTLATGYLMGAPATAAKDVLATSLIGIALVQQNEFARAKSCLSQARDTQTSATPAEKANCPEIEKLNAMIVAKQEAFPLRGMLGALQTCPQGVLLGQKTVSEVVLG